MAANSSINSAPAQRVGARRRWPRTLLLGGFWASTTLVLLAAIFMVWLRNAAKAALPQLDGEIHISVQGFKGLSLQVTVQRDQHGVPHIDAASQEDLFLAQGYVTAQDRLWQM